MLNIEQHMTQLASHGNTKHSGSVGVLSGTKGEHYTTDFYWTKSHCWYYLRRVLLGKGIQGTCNVAVLTTMVASPHRERRSLRIANKRSDLILLLLKGLLLVVHH